MEDRTPATQMAQTFYVPMKGLDAILLIAGNVLVIELKGDGTDHPAYLEQSRLAIDACPIDNAVVPSS